MCRARRGCSWCHHRRAGVQGDSGLRQLHVLGGGGKTAVCINVSLCAELEEAAASAITVELESKEIQDFDNYTWGIGGKTAVCIYVSLCELDSKQIQDFDNYMIWGGGRPLSVFM